MLRQGRFYSSIEAMEGIQIDARFEQNGPRGYLPLRSQGACAFTTLDFHRVFSQGVVPQWIGHKRSLLGSAFAQRQQLLYEDPSMVIRDPYFLANLNNEEVAHLGNDPNIAISSRAPTDDNVDDSFNNIESILRQQARQGNNLIRFNFNAKENHHEYGHVIAIAIDPNDPGHCQIMEPNAGVFSLRIDKVQPFLQCLRSNLYQDYQLSNFHIECQQPFWMGRNQRAGVELEQMEYDFDSHPPINYSQALEQHRVDRERQMQHDNERIADIDVDFPEDLDKDEEVAQLLRAIPHITFGSNDNFMLQLKNKLDSLDGDRENWTEEQTAEFQHIKQQINGIQSDPAIKKIHSIIEDYYKEKGRFTVGIQDKIDRINHAISALPINMRRHLHDFSIDADPLIKEVHRALASHRHIHRKTDEAWCHKTQTIDEKKAASAFLSFKNHFNQSLHAPAESKQKDDDKTGDDSHLDI